MAEPGVSARRREHVEALCEEHRVRWVIRRDHPRAHADPGERVITTLPVTMVRSYFTALHEIAHCVLGYDHGAPAAPQEVAAWEWAIATAIEDPTPGLLRHIFRVLWHYLLRDMQHPHEEQRTFPEPDDPFWAMLGSLDDGARLLYEAAKLTDLKIVPETSDWEWRILDTEDADRAQAIIDRFRQGVADEEARADAKLAALRSRWGPPQPAAKGAAAQIGEGKAVHAFRGAGRFGVVLGADDQNNGALWCSSPGFVHPAQPGAAVTCRRCLAEVARR
ncbi:unannotated protein [freshwater metagenome]|uniref:Unannotated protein n=1 Tax=freshwater metagenome TaxID=449393 RepID=A0A6J7JB35_9ZZZZ|nr:hypothetical protein [Actinomycetota bacterium]